MSQVERIEVPDTALWVAHLRALESERPDALFRDPFARLLSGEKGEALARSLVRDNAVWVLTVRTVIIDRLIREAVSEGFDAVLNLAAGLDTRPYRLDLPPHLHWYEVDFDHMLAFKAHHLQAERPRCHHHTIAQDLRDGPGTAQVLDRVAAAHHKVLVITEGLLIYLPTEVVGSLAAQLRARPTFSRWIANYTSGLGMTLIRPLWYRQLKGRDVSDLFAPSHGPGFFQQHGWREAQFYSFLAEGHKMRRLTGFAKVAGAVIEALPSPWTTDVRRLMTLAVMEPSTA